MYNYYNNYINYYTYLYVCEYHTTHNGTIIQIVSVHFNNFFNKYFTIQFAKYTMFTLLATFSFFLKLMKDSWKYLYYLCAEYNIT